uniref:Mitochondrial antiviral-signaling protein n=1 Tax=Channa argus TaxID=215402 RepID=A0A8G0RE63_CHAAH|nr:mitochondrial antiviral-signaling protein [Channa argus]
MTYVNEKLSKGYLRTNMSTIVSKVKVREIVVHLPCLTDHDRETIEAKRENNGNYDGMVLLLECLKRRENWPEQLIEALEACEQPTLAAEMRAEYNALRGIKTSNPNSPSTTVVSAHVHPPPCESHPSIPKTSGNIHAIVAPSAEASALPEPAAHSSSLETPVQPHDIQSPAAQVPKAVSPPPQREVNTHQEPEENSESDIQDITGVTPDQVSSANSEVPVKSVVTPSPCRPVEQCETDTQPVQTSTRVTEVRPSLSPSPTQTRSDVTDKSSSLTLTPEGPPVQDTTPPVEKVFSPVLETGGTSAPPATQVPKSQPQTNVTATASPLPGAPVVGASVFNDNSVCLSKPGRLISIQPQNHDNPTMPANNTLVEPYSGNSARLEISYAAPDTVTSAHVAACSAVSSTAVTTTSGRQCQENGITLNYNEPEENHYESPCQSLQMQEVCVNVVHVSEEPSILNLDGQTSAPHAQTVKSEAAQEITSAPPFVSTAADTVSSSNTHSSENYHPSEPAPQPPSEENRATALTTNTNYIMTAAAVAALTLLLAWKFKN